MNVLLVSQFFSGGGLERMVRLLGESLANDLNCKVHLFAFDGPEDDELKRGLESKNVSVHFKRKGPGFSMDTAVEISKLLRRYKIDAIHTHESAPLIYACLGKMLAFKRARIVHTQHSFIHLETKSHVGRYDRLFQKGAAWLTVVSDQVRNHYKELGVDTARIQVVPNGVEMPSSPLPLSEKKKQKERLAENRPELKAHVNRLWVLAVARLHPKKGQDQLIKIWEFLEPAIREKAVLVLLGPETEPGEKARLVEMAKKIPAPCYIVFAGSTNQPLDWLQAADLFASGSEYEGMPLAPIEAAGCGLPLFLSRIQGHEVLSNFARFFQLHSPEQAAPLLAHFLEELEQAPDKVAATSHRNAKVIQNQYSVRKMAETYLGLYQAET